MFAISINAKPVDNLQSVTSHPLFSIEDEVKFSIQNRGLGGITLDITLPPMAHQLIEYDNDNPETPPLPFVSRLVVIPDGVNTTLHVTRQEGRSWSSHFGYQEKVINSEMASPVALGKPVILRGIRMIPVIVQSYQLLTKSNEIFENHSITVELEFTPDESDSPGFNRRGPYSPHFARMLDNLVLNPPARDLAPNHRARILVVHSEGLLEEENAVADIETFAEWKKRLGYDVIVHPIDTEQDQDDIKGEIREFYNEEESIEFLIIMGHYDPRDFEEDEDSPYFFPTWRDSVEVDRQGLIRISGDAFFVTFDGEEDLLPDVIVGRFTCPTYEDLSYALFRSMNYEQDPLDGEWLRQAVYTICTKTPQSSNEIAMWSSNRLQQLGFADVDIIIDNELSFIEPLKEIFEQGVSFALGDYWLNGMVRFERPEDELVIVDIAEVGRMHPFAISDAEFWGRPFMISFFNSGSEEEPNGIVAGYGFWTHPTSRLSRDLNGWTVWAMHNMNEFSGGYLFQYVGLQVLSTWEPWDGIETYRWQMYGEYRYIGDPTLQIRTAQPTDLTVIHPESFNTGATMIQLTVTDDEDNPVPGSVVCIRQEDNFQYVTESNGIGEIIFTVPEGLEGGRLQITALQHNCIPYIADIEVSDQQVNIILNEAGFDDSETGDDDGLFRNGETVRLDLTLSNAGEQAARNLIAAFSSDCEYLSFNPEEAEVEDMPPHRSGELAEPVTMTLDPNCPAATVIQTQVNVRSGDDHWLIAFEFTTSSADFQIGEINVNNLEPGRVGTIAPELTNIGDLSSSELQATLTSLTPAVNVTVNRRTYPVLDPDESNNSNQPFTIVIGELFIPGQPVRFELHLTGEDEFNKVLTFSTDPIGETEAGDPLGPDGYGYICLDSDDEGWRDHPVYNWLEINPDVIDAENPYPGEKVVIEPDTSLNYMNWDISVELPLPFTFQYYGQEFDDIVVCTNGWLAMGTEAADCVSPIGWRIPGIGAPDGQICPYLLDLEIFLGRHYYGGIFYYYIEDRDVFVIEWSDIEVRTYGERSLHLAFQVLFYNPEVYSTSTGDGEIVFQYQNYEAVRGPFWDYPFPTVGIRSLDGNDGILYSWRNNEYEGAPVQASPIRDEFAIKFTTQVEYSAGSIRGRIVRSEDHTQSIPDATVSLLRGGEVQTNDQGYFQFNDLRIGTYGIRIEANGFNSISAEFNIISGAGIEILEPFQLTHPEPFLDENNRELRVSLRPDGSRTRADVCLQNTGNGPLEYRAEVRYADGAELEFNMLNSFSINEMMHGNDIEDSIRAYGLAFVDSVFYIPCHVRRVQRNFIATVNMEGELQTIIESPIEYEEGRIKNLTWDGEALWGSYWSYTEENSRMIRFDLEGNISNTIIVPFNTYHTLPLIYCPERQSLFVTDDGEDILEFDFEGNIISQNSIRFPGRVTQIRGLGWISTDSMPLYLIDNYFEFNEPFIFRIIKMNPECGEYEIITEIEMFEDIHYTSGMAAVQNYNHEHSAFALVQNYRGMRQAQDTLVIRELGPNVSFMVEGSLRNTNGTIQAGDNVRFGFEIDADGYSEGAYMWSYFITHNALEDPILVPVTLTIDRNSGFDDNNVEPVNEFALNSIYPNPFNGMTRITFSVDRPAQTSIHAYDLSGRLIETIYNNCPSIGKHSAIWDASCLPSGMYLFILETERRYRFKKVVLIR